VLDGLQAEMAASGIDVGARAQLPAGAVVDEDEAVAEQLAAEDAAAEAPAAEAVAEPAPNGHATDEATA
jgi:hypothetical protein